MEFKVLFEGDEGIYIVKKGEYFYTIDTLEDTKPMKSKYIETFIKFGGFDSVNYEVTDDVLEKIKTVLDKYDGFLI